MNVFLVKTIEKMFVINYISDVTCYSIDDERGRV